MDRGGRAILILVLIGSFLVGISSMVGISLYRNQMENLDAVVMQRAKRVENRVGADLKRKVLALQRQAERQADGEQTQLHTAWERDARNYLRDFLAYRSICRLDRYGKLLQEVRAVEKEVNGAPIPSVDSLIDEKILLRASRTSDAFFVPFAPGTDAGNTGLVVAPVQGAEGFQGVIAADVDVPKFFEVNLGSDELEGINVTILHEGRTFFEEKQSGGLNSRTVELEGSRGDSDWLFQVVPTFSLVKRHSNASPFLVTLAGMVLSFGFPWMLWLIRQTARSRHELEVLNEVLEDRVRARTEQVERNEKRFKQMTESLPQLVWTCLPTGKCDYLSPQWVRYTGIPEATQLDYGWLEQLHPDDKDRVSREWAEASKEGKLFSIEFRIRRHDGQFRWFKTLALPVYDNRGQIEKWFGTNTDIEDLRETRSALQKLNEDLETVVSERSKRLEWLSRRLQLALDSGGMGVWDWNITKNHLEWDETMYRLYGIRSGDYPDAYEAWSNLVHPEDLEQVNEAVEKALSGEGEFDVKFRIVRPDGETINMRGRGVVTRDAEGNATRMLGVNWDNSEQIHA